MLEYNLISSWCRPLQIDILLKNARQEHLKKKKKEFDVEYLSLYWWPGSRKKQQFESIAGEQQIIKQQPHTGVEAAPVMYICSLIFMDSMRYSSSTSGPVHWGYNKLEPPKLQRREWEGNAEDKTIVPRPHLSCFLHMLLFTPSLCRSSSSSSGRSARLYVLPYAAA